MQLISVLIDPKAVKRAKDLGKDRGLTISQILREALHSWTRRETAIARAFQSGT
jgi:hypothetical protein